MLISTIRPASSIGVNVLVYAHRDDAPDRSRSRQWLTDLNGDTAYSVADPVPSGFLRVVTQPRVLRAPPCAGTTL